MVMRSVLFFNFVPVKIVRANFQDPRLPCDFVKQNCLLCADVTGNIIPVWQYKTNRTKNDCRQQYPAERNMLQYFISEGKYIQLGRFTCNICWNITVFKRALQHPLRTGSTTMTLTYTKSHKISRQNLQFAQIFIQNFPLCLTGLHEKRPKSPRHAPSSEPRPFPRPSRQLAPQRPQKRKKAARFLLPPPSFQQLALLLLPDQRKTAPKGLHGEVRFAENELVDNFRRKQRQPGRLRYHAGVDADGFRQRLDVGVSPVVDQRLPMIVRKKSN